MAWDLKDIINNKADSNGKSMVATADKRDMEEAISTADESRDASRLGNL